MSESGTPGVQVSKTELLQTLELTEGRLKKMQRKGCPGANGNGRGATWNLLAVARWIVSQPVHPQEKPEPRKRAADILRAHETPEQPGGEAPGTTEASCDEFGLEAALVRLRRAESETYQRWLQAIGANDPDQAQHFQNWQRALDLLRKAEGNLLELLERKRQLLPADEVRTFMSRRVEEAKATLLDMPGKLAPSLENLPWTEIQKSIEQEVHHALEKLSRNLD